jgi:hypothetical protein
MLVNTTFNNIWVILWRSVLLVDETGGPWENHRPTINHLQTLSLKSCIEYTSLWVGFELTTLVVMGTDWLHVIVNPTTLYHTTTTARCLFLRDHSVCQHIWSWDKLSLNRSLICIFKTFLSGLLEEGDLP